MEEAEPNSAATRHHIADILVASVNMAEKFWFADWQAGMMYMILDNAEHQHRVSMMHWNAYLAAHGELDRPWLKAQPQTPGTMVQTFANGFPCSKDHNV